MKKVLYITTVSRTLNAFLVPHIQMLLDEGYQVDIATCIDKPIDSSLLNQKVTVYNIPFRRNPLQPGNLKAFMKLIQIQKKEQYDIVHVHTPVASLFGRLLKIRFPKIKVHSIDNKSCSPIFRCFLNIRHMIPMAIQKIPSSPKDVIPSIILSNTGLCSSCNA